MNCKPGSKHERAFIEAIRIEIAGGRTQFDRETVQRLIRAYNAEAYRFDCLALDVAYDIELDDQHLDTMYREFTSTRNRVAEVDAFGMRDQIDQDDDYNGKDSDAE